MEEPPKETVIIVHGTWAAPEPGKRKWYQPIDDRLGGEPFTAKLDAALQQRGSPARCWAHCTGGNPIFQWSGENSWIARTQAASLLGNYVAKLQSQGWRCHIVAHSHGGNVVVEALPQIITASDSNKPSSRLVTLGTPFIDTISPLIEKADWQRKNLSMITFILFAFVMAKQLASFILLRAPPAPQTFGDPQSTIRFMIFLLLVVMGVLGTYVYRRWQTAPGGFRETIKTRWKYWMLDSAYGIFLSVLIVLAWNLSLYYIWVQFDNLVVRGDSSFPELFRSIAILVVLIVVQNIAARFRRRLGYTGRGRPWLQLSEASQARPLMLAIGSRTDEAWQICHHMRQSDNPLAVKSNLLKYVFSSLRSAISQKADAAHVRGAKSYRDLSVPTKMATASMHLLSFIGLLYIVYLYREQILSDVNPVPSEGLDEMLAYIGRSIAEAITVIGLVTLFSALTMLCGNNFASAFFSPVRWCAQRARSLVAVFVSTGTYLARSKSWPVLLKMVLGLEGYRFTMPLIEQFPTSVPESFVKYVDIPKGAEQRAKDRRSAWVARHLGDVSEIFSKLAVTAADITSLLRAVEEDQTLVHAAYYTDDECIARIAAWIAGRG